MYTYTAEVLDVIDGDTIEVDFDLGFGVWLRNQRIRLDGIDTPESRTSNKEEKPRGLLSKKKLKEILGKRITITTKLDPNEKFGRILGVIKNEAGVNINNWLIENNYAVAYTGQNKELVQEAHQKNAVILKQRGEL